MKNNCSMVKHIKSKEWGGVKYIDVDELKHLQCEVMQVFHEFCMENHLKYSLACGSLLGAIRHNGYIPWDDDIDVYMQREDYEKLIKLFPDVYRNYYKLISYERSNSWLRPYANLFDDRTVWEELKSQKETQIGVNIDIFPVDCVPNEDKEWEIFNKKRRLLIYLQSAKYVVLRKDRRPLWKNLGLVFLKILLLPISSKALLAYMDKYIQQYNTKGTNRLFETSCGMEQKRPFLKSDFERTIPHKFENYVFNVMEGYHECLSSGFGDYMQLPPIEKRVSQHYYVAFWKD